MIQGLSKSKFKHRVFKSSYRKRFGLKGSWLLFLVAVVAMLFLNWKLLLATSAGVGIMLLVYLMQGWHWQIYWSKLRKFFSGSNQQLTIAVGSGGIAAFSTYMATSIWVDSESRWLATGGILQGLATFITLSLLIWHIISSQSNRDEAKFDQLLTDLTHINPLKRLIALRKLTYLVNNTSLSKNHRYQLVEYLHLMLAQESESIIREALLESLQMWDETKQLRRNLQPLQIPINLKQTTNQVHK